MITPDLAPMRGSRLERIIKRLAHDVPLASSIDRELSRLAYDIAALPGAHELDAIPDDMLAAYLVESFLQACARSKS